MALVDDALAIYLCDDAAGGTLTDLTANSNDGTLSNAGWDTIDGEACLDMTGATSVVNCGDFGMDGNDITIMMRIQFITAIPDDEDIISKYLTSGTGRSWRIRSRANGRVTGQLSENGTGNAGRTGVATGDTVLGTWANIVCTFDGDGADACVYTVYKDDTTNSDDSSPTGHGFMFANATDILLGGSDVDNNMYLRNIVLMTGIATAQQITDHHNEVFTAVGGGPKGPLGHPLSGPFGGPI